MLLYMLCILWCEMFVQMNCTWL